MRQKKVFTIIFSIFLILSGSFVFAGEVEVYDDNNQFLGIFLGHIIFDRNADNISDSPGLEIFVPQLNGTIRIDKEFGELWQMKSYSPFYYESNDCTGQPYFSEIDYSSVGIFRKHHILTGNYYMQTGRSVSITPQSQRWFDAPDFTGCINEVGTPPAFLYEVVEISAFPFNLPIAPPFRYTYQDGGTGVVGDINGDGVVGLSEAINALRVVAGVN